MNAVIKGMIAAVALVALSGCTKRAILKFEDHPEQNQTFAETLRHDDYWLSSSFTHEFWLCKDEDKQLICKKTCEGDTDLACPAAGVSVTIAGNNTQ